MPRCTNCDKHVTVNFARVFGDNDDTVHNCLACSTRRGLGDDVNSERADGQPSWLTPGR